MSAWPEAVERVAVALREAQVDARIEEFAEGTATAQEAADAVGCKLQQIVKSLVFVTDESAAVVLIPGDRRADTAKVAKAFGAERAKVASPDEVRALTGFEPGAVAPFPLPHVEHVFVDRALLTQPELWIGAGSSRHLAAIRPADLIRLAHATTVDAAQRAG
jgi:Cys-tRNA(Pro) deacylase